MKKRQPTGHNRLTSVDNDETDVTPEGNIHLNVMGGNFKYPCVFEVVARYIITVAASLTTTVQWQMK